jgi:hypothetical protein
VARVDLNTDQMRELASWLLETAAEMDKVGDGEMTGNHVCGLDWCEVTFADEDEHWSMVYTQITHPAFRQLTVGSGVSWHKGEDGSEPAIVVHIIGEDGEVDEDARLRLSEAVELRDLLDRAIGIADEVETAQTTSP